MLTFPPMWSLDTLAELREYQYPPPPAALSASFWAFFMSVHARFSQSVSFAAASAMISFSKPSTLRINVETPRPSMWKLDASFRSRRRASAPSMSSFMMSSAATMASSMSENSCATAGFVSELVEALGCDTGVGFRLISVGVATWDDAFEDVPEAGPRSQERRDMVRLRGGSRGRGDQGSKVVRDTERKGTSRGH